MEKLAKAYVYDYETVKNCFLAVFINIKNPNDILSFEISTYQNQAKDFTKLLDEFIKEKTLLVSYNGLKFDNQISRFINTKAFNLLDDLAENIYEFAQDVIKRSNNKEFPYYHPKDNQFNECDILAINNYDNPAKRSSLKWLQYNMDWHNVEDMSTKHDAFHNEKDILQLKSYCINDCLSTRELFFRNKSEILLRMDLSKHFKLKLNNASEPKLAKKIFLKLLAEKMEIDEYELIKKKTYRSKINLNEVILPYIKFQTKVLKDTLSQFKKTKLDGENLKGSFSKVVTYRGLELSFALGGIHGAKKGVYTSDENNIIKSFDVTSFYPNLAIRNRWSPGHLPNELFCDIYESFFEERKKYSKKDPLNYVYKILLNSTYGLSNEKDSFLKDSMFTMKITCNGQLLLVMLLEELCESIPGARPIMINTDGGEIIIPKEYEDKYHEICSKWEKQTLLQLEFEKYSKLIIPDVNNYIGVYAPKEIPKEKALEMIKDFPKPLIKKTKDGKYNYYGVKCKGRFEIDKPLHKNKSYRINRIAYYNYFVHGISPEETIKQNKNIFDYCAGVRATGSWKFVSTCVTDGNILDNNLPKTLRYYRTNLGCKIRKLTDVNDTVKSIKIEADRSLERVINRIDSNTSFDSYNIDFNFYIRKINKEINNIIPTQTQQILDL